MPNLNELLKTTYGEVVKTDTFIKTTKNSLSGKKRKMRGMLPNMPDNTDIGAVLAAAGDRTNIAYKKYADALKIFQSYLRNEKSIADGKARKNPISDKDALKAIAEMMENVGTIWTGLRESYNIGYVVLKESGYGDNKNVNKNANELKRALREGDMDTGAKALAELLKANPEMAELLTTYGVKATVQ